MTSSKVKRTVEIVHGVELDGSIRAHAPSAAEASLSGSAMSHEYEDISTDLTALLSLLEDVLSADQLWELQVLLDYDEYSLAFDGICAALKCSGATVSAVAYRELRHVSKRMRVDEATWLHVRHARERRH